MIKKVGQLVLSLLFFILLIEILLRIGFFNILEVLREVNWLLFSAAIVVSLVSYLVWAKKWEMLLDKITDVKLFDVFFTLMGSLFAYITTPNPHLGGEPIRAYYSSKLTGRSKTKMYAGIMFDRHTNTLSLLFMIIASVVALLFTRNLPGQAIYVLYVVLAVCFVWSYLQVRFFMRSRSLKKIFNRWIVRKAFYLFKKLRNRYKTASQLEGTVDKKIQSYRDVYRGYKNDKSLFRSELILGGARWIFFTLSTYVLFLSTGVHVNFLYILIIQTIAFVIGIISFIPGGLGITESSMIVLYYAFGIDVSAAATVAIFNRIILYFNSFVVGVLCLMFVRKKVKVSPNE